MVDVDPRVWRRFQFAVSGVPGFVVPNGMAWLPELISARLATDATVVDRQLVLRQYTTGLVNPVYNAAWFDAVGLQPASTIRYYSWVRGGDYSIRTGTLYDGENHCLPGNVMLSGGYLFGLENGQPGDSLNVTIVGWERALC